MMSARLLIAVVLVSLALAASTAIGRADAAAQKQQGTAQASARLMKELMETFKSDSYKKGVFKVDLVDDNLYEWDVKLYLPDSKYPLAKDLIRLKAAGKRDHVVLRIKFPPNYPNEVPFVRVVYPIIDKRATGALCIYMLSPQGWVPDFTMESFILTVMDHLLHSHGVDFSTRATEYSGRGSAQEYKELIQSHGWDKPRPKGLLYYEGPPR